MRPLPPRAATAPLTPPQLHIERARHVHRAAHAVLVKAPAPVGAREPGAVHPLDFRAAALGGHGGVCIDGMVIAHPAQYLVRIDRLARLSVTTKGSGESSPCSRFMQ